MPDPVELHHAYIWDCPECGIEQIARVVTLRGDELRAKFPECDHDAVNLYPERVQCSDCGTDFDVADPTAGQEDDR